jgi:hypothetical protein
MSVAAQRKTNACKQTHADNQNISFLPAIMSTSNRMHGEFLRLLVLQAHRETEAQRVFVKTRKWHRTSSVQKTMLAIHL